MFLQTEKMNQEKRPHFYDRKTFLMLFVLAIFASIFRIFSKKWGCKKHSLQPKKNHGKESFSPCFCKPKQKQKHNPNKKEKT